MKGTVIHFQPTRNSNIGSGKYAVFLSGLYGFTLQDGAGKKPKHKQDVVIVMDSSTVFCDWVKEAKEVIRGAKKVFVCRYDHEVKTDSDAKKKNPIILSSIDDGRMDDYLDWNKFSYYDHGIQKDSDVKYDGIGYYGTYRKDRVEYFERYFTSNDGLSGNLPTTVATTTPNKKKFALLGAEVRGPIKSMNELKVFRCLLFLQDKKTSVSTGIACRFYEALSAGVPQLFDIDCVPRFKAQGFDIREFTVSTREDVARMLDKLPEIKKKQMLWRKDYRAIFRKQVIKIFKKYGVLPCE